MAKEGQTPGDGKTSPFGDGKGNTQGGGASGGHVFLTNPTSNATGGGGFDVSKQNRAQQACGPAGSGNADSIPEGGRTPWGQQPGNPKPRTPIKLDGAEPTATPTPISTSPGGSDDPDVDVASASKAAGDLPED